MNLEQLIDEAYGKNQAELKAKKVAEELKHQQWTQEVIAKFTSRLDEAIPPELQQALSLKIYGFYDRTSYADFEYRGESVRIITWGDYEWKAMRNGDYIAAGNPEEFLNSLLIALGEIRASFVEPEPEPESMTLEQAAGTLNDCLALAEDVYSHRHDFVYNPEEFGSSLKAAICLVSKLLDELAESEEE